MAEKYTNADSTTVAVGGYTSGSGVLNVAASAGDNNGFPTAADFRVSIFNQSTGALIVTLKVTAINSSTQLAVTAEGTDANASAGDIVRNVITAGALDAVRSNLISYGTYANLPASGKQGDFYKCTDTPYEFIYSGSVWQAFLPGYGAVTLPDETGFSWVNQGTATLDTTYGSSYISDKPASSAITWRLRVASAGSSLSKSFLFTPHVGISTLAGVGFRESSTGKLMIISYNGYESPARITVDYWSSPTSYGSFTGFTWYLKIPHPLIVGFRIRIASSTIYFDVRETASRWYSAYNESFTSHFTTGPDQYLYGIDSENATHTSMDVLSID